MKEHLHSGFKSLLARAHGGYKVCTFPGSLSKDKICFRSALWLLLMLIQDPPPHTECTTTSFKLFLQQSCNNQGCKSPSCTQQVSTTHEGSSPPRRAGSLPRTQTQPTELPISLPVSVLQHRSPRSAAELPSRPDSFTRDESH